MAVSRYSMELAGRTLTLETGRMAKQAGGAVQDEGQAGQQAAQAASENGQQGGYLAYAVDDMRARGMGTTPDPRQQRPRPTRSDESGSDRAGDTRVHVVSLASTGQAGLPYPHGGTAQHSLGRASPLGRP